jgi:hypothetical protein
MGKHQPISPDLRQRAYRLETVPEPAEAAGCQENQRVRKDRKQNGPLTLMTGLIRLTERCRNSDGRGERTLIAVGNPRQDIPSRNYSRHRSHRSELQACTSIRGVVNGHQRDACRRRQAGLNCFEVLVTEAGLEERRHGVRHRRLCAIDFLVRRLA